MDELDFELEEDKKVERIRNLSEKVKLTAQERDDMAKAKEELEKSKADTERAREEAEKERDFYKGFNTVSSKYQGASEFQDKILEKVRSGYDIEDATVAILNREGKLNSTTPQQPKEAPIGGSAMNQLKGEGSKPLNEMSFEDKRKALLDMESGGDISWT